LPGGAGRIIQRTNKAGFFFQEQDHFFLVPEMIATGDDINSRGEEFLGRLDRDA